MMAGQLHRAPAAGKHSLPCGVGSSHLIPPCWPNAPCLNKNPTLPRHPPVVAPSPEPGEAGEVVRNRPPLPKVAARSLLPGQETLTGMRLALKWPKALLSSLSRSLLGTQRYLGRLREEAESEGNQLRASTEGCRPASPQASSGAAHKHYNQSGMRDPRGLSHSTTPAPASFPQLPFEHSQTLTGNTCLIPTRSDNQTGLDGPWLLKEADLPVTRTFPNPATPTTHKTPPDPSHINMHRQRRELRVCWPTASLPRVLEESSHQLSPDRPSTYSSREFDSQRIFP